METASFNVAHRRSFRGFHRLTENIDHHIPFNLNPNHFCRRESPRFNLWAFQSTRRPSTSNRLSVIVGVKNEPPSSAAAAMEPLQHPSTRPLRIFVLIDYPGVNIPFGKYIKQHFYCKIIYYIPPNEWIWTTARTHTTVRMSDLILSVHESESLYYKNAGATVVNIGHPLIDKFCQMSHKEARAKLGVEEDEFVVALIPASREQEVRHVWPLIVSAAKYLFDICQTHRRSIRFFVPVKLPNQVKAFNVFLEKYGLLKHAQLWLVADLVEGVWLPKNVHTTLQEPSTRLNHREDFEPFVEDDMPFDEYCRSMQEDGTWAGHMELQAASLVTQTNICIHRHMSPRWHIRNFNRIGTRTLHLSYHDGEHYNSIRLQNDDSLGPAQLIVIEEDDNHARPMEDILVNSGMPSGNKVYDQALVKLVMVGTGCTDAVRVCQVLQEVYGDADAAIEFLIAEQNASVCSMQDAVQSCSELTSNAGGDKEELKDNLPKTNASPQRKAVDESASSSEGEKDGHEQRKGAHNEFAPSHQKVSRNNPCPCGSKKKYKACCEATRQKFSAKIMISREILTNKTRKQKLRNDKSELQSSSLQPQSREGPPDLGGLYI